jgi:hypothetical protein
MFGHYHGHRNFLKIDATAIIIGKTQNFSVPFNHNIKNNTFIPKSFNIKWEDVTELHISLDVSYEITVWAKQNGVPFPQESGAGFYKIIQKWDVNYSQDGISLLGSRAIDQGSSPGKEATLVVAMNLNVQEYNKKTTLSAAIMVLKFSLGYTRQGATFGFSVGPFSASGGGGSTSSGYSKDYEIRMDYLAVGKPEAAKAKVMLPDDVIRGPIITFERDEWDMPGDMLNRIRTDWYIPLNRQYPALSEAVKDARVPISVFGYASSTGTPQHNLELSAKRANSVVQALKIVTGSDKLWIIIVPRGSSQVRTAGEVDQEKRVSFELARETSELIVSDAGTKP